MKLSYKYKVVIVVLLIVAIFIVFIIYQNFNKSKLTTEQLQAKGIVIFDIQKTFEIKGLINHDGQDFTKKDMDGWWSIVYFGYTFCPDICPISLGQMNDMDQELKKQNPSLANTVQYIMVSVDPQRDTPEKLKDYLSYFNQKFIGVTGDVNNIHSLALQLNAAFTKVANLNDKFYLVDHSANLVIINPKGNYHGYIRPPLEPEKLSLILQSIDKTY